LLGVAIGAAIGGANGAGWIGRKNKLI